jgi:hypothetical protein
MRLHPILSPQSDPFTAQFNDHPAQAKRLFPFRTLYHLVHACAFFRITHRWYCIIGSYTPWPLALTLGGFFNGPMPPGYRHPFRTDFWQTQARGGI